MSDDRFSFRVFFYDGVDYKTGNMISAKEAFCENYIQWNNKGGLVPTDECSILMQSTGLRDKNGVLLFDDDVVHLYGYGDYHIKFPYIELYERAFEGDMGELKENIHENPELLEE